MRSLPGTKRLHGAGMHNAFGLQRSPVDARTLNILPPAVAPRVPSLGCCFAVCRGFWNLGKGGVQQAARKCFSRLPSPCDMICWPANGGGLPETG